MQIARLNRREIHVEIIDTRTSLEEFDNIKNTINNLAHIRSTLNSILYVTTDVVPTVDFLVSKLNTIYLYTIESSMVSTNMYFIMHLYQYLQNLLHHLVETNSLGFIVVDTSYCENDWISGQTDKYHALRRLRNTYLQIPWIVTTQKASYEVNIKTKTISSNNFK